MLPDHYDIANEQSNAIIKYNSVGWIDNGKPYRKIIGIKLEGKEVVNVKISEIANHFSSIKSSCHDFSSVTMFIRV